MSSNNKQVMWTLCTDAIIAGISVNTLIRHYRLPARRVKVMYKQLSLHDVDLRLEETAYMYE